MSVYEAVHVSHTKSNIYKIRYEKKKTFCQHNRQPPYSIASNNHWSIVNIFPVDLYSQLSIVDFFLHSISMTPRRICSPLRLCSVPSFLNAISTHGKGDTMNSRRYFFTRPERGVMVEGAVSVSLYVCSVEMGVQYPQGRAAQIQGNKNASIFGRGLLSPLTAECTKGGPQ